MKKGLLILTAAALFHCAAWCGGITTLLVDRDRPAYTPAIDSILNVIETLDGQEAIDQYGALHTALYELRDVELHLQFNQRFIDAARAIDNPSEIGYLLGTRMEALINHKVPRERLIGEITSTLEILRGYQGNRKVETYYFNVAMMLTEYHLMNGEYDRALELCERWYAEAEEMDNNSGVVLALRSMAGTYYALQRYEKAAETFREAISVADDMVDPIPKHESYKFLIDLLVTLDRPEEALEACNEYDAFIDRFESRNPHRLVKPRFYCDLAYATVYRELERYQLAEEYIRRAEGNPTIHLANGEFAVEDERYRLMLDQGKYAEAEKSLDRIDEIYSEIASFHDRISILLMRANLYMDWERYDKAARAFVEYIEGRDSLQTVELTESLNALRTQYEVDKLEMQKEQQRITFRNTLRSLSVALALLSVIIAVVVVNGRRLRTKNRSLLDRIAELDRMERENEQLRTELARSEGSVSAGDEEDCRYAELYFRLREMMKDPAVFTDPGITRKSIAERLGTNEKYVFDMIHKYYGMSISDYITNLRLNYSRNLLALPRQTRTIEAVALDAGFSSRSTFHRLFKERYGMTPDEFRRLVAGS